MGFARGKFAKRGDFPLFSGAQSQRQHREHIHEILPATGTLGQAKPVTNSHWQLYYNFSSVF
jgi:hypothetical protein